MNTLFISRFNPFINSGGSYATKAYIDAFVELSNSLTLMIPDNCDVPQNYKKSVQIIKVPDRSIIQKILFFVTGNLHRFIPFFYDYWEKNAHKENYDVVILNGGILGDIAKFLNNKDVKIITIHHNVESHYHLDSKTIESFFGLSSVFINRKEKSALLNSHLNLTISKQDLEELKTNYNLSSQIKIAYLGCFEHKDKKSPIIANNINKPFNCIKLAITGSLCDYQTQEGIFYFLKELNPEIMKRYPDLKVIISGRNPDKKMMNRCIATKNIELIINPINMDTVISQSDIYICPTRIGGGLKLRIMDGLRNGKPILTNIISAKGYDEFFQKDYFKQYSTKEDFFLHLDYLLKQSFNSRYIFNEYITFFSFQSGVEQLRNLLKNL